MFTGWEKDNVLPVVKKYSVTVINENPSCSISDISRSDGTTQKSQNDAIFKKNLIDILVHLLYLVYFICSIAFSLIPNQTSRPIL